MVAALALAGDELQGSPPFSAPLPPGCAPLPPVTRCSGAVAVGPSSDSSDYEDDWDGEKKEADAAAEKVRFSIDFGLCFTDFGLLFTDYGPLLTYVGLSLVNFGLCLTDVGLF